MLENYYYAKLFLCTQAGHTTFTSLDGKKYYAQVMPVLSLVGPVECKKQNEEYKDIFNNKNYIKAKFNEDLDKGKLYIKNEISLNQALKYFNLSEKLDILKTIILIESANKINKLTSKQKTKMKEIVKK